MLRSTKYGIRDNVNDSFKFSSPRELHLPNIKSFRCLKKLCKAFICNFHKKHFFVIFFNFISADVKKILWVMAFSRLFFEESLGKSWLVSKVCIYCRRSFQTYVDYDNLFEMLLVISKKTLDKSN